MQRGILGVLRRLGMTLGLKSRFKSLFNSSRVILAYDWASDNLFIQKCHVSEQ